MSFGKDSTDSTALYIGKPNEVEITSRDPHHLDATKATYAQATLVKQFGFEPLGRTVNVFKFCPTPKPLEHTSS